jgi:hypothetical protein
MQIIARLDIGHLPANRKVFNGIESQHESLDSLRGTYKYI